MRLCGHPETVPSGWVTYSDETSGFSLSYPNEWEVFVLDETAVADLLAGLEDANPATKSVAMPFQVGLPQSNGGFDPSVAITVEAIPDDVSSEEFSEMGKRGLGLVFPSYVSTEQVKTVVGRRDSVLVHGSHAMSELDPGLDGRYWTIQPSTTDGATGWTVTCGRVVVDPSAAAPDLEECNTIVRTFELSSP